MKLTDLAKSVAMALMTAFLVLAAATYLRSDPAGDSFRCGYVIGVADVTNAINATAPRPVVSLGEFMAKQVEDRCDGVEIPKERMALTATVEDQA